MQAHNLLETERLFLRIDTKEDYERVFSTESNEVIKAYFGLQTDETLQTQRMKVEGGLCNYRTSVVFVHLIEKQEQKVIGSFAYHNWYPMHSRSEIGYDMKIEEYKNKGFMKEALPLIIRYGFGEMNLHRMEAYIHPDNLASRRLVEGAGFTEEARLKENYTDNGIQVDSIVYRLLHKEYQP